MRKRFIQPILIHPSYREELFGSGGPFYNTLVQKIPLLREIWQLPPKDRVVALASLVLSVLLLGAIILLGRAPTGAVIFVLVLFLFWSNYSAFLRSRVALGKRRFWIGAALCAGAVGGCILWLLGGGEAWFPCTILLLLLPSLAMLYHRRPI